jgi:hypothetical protein
MGKTRNKRNVLDEKPKEKTTLKEVTGKDDTELDVTDREVLGWTNVVRRMGQRCDLVKN